MHPSDPYVHIRRSPREAYVVPLAVVNAHRAERCARHDARAGRGRYESSFAAELAYGREHVEALRDWACTNMSWAELEPHARLVRECLRG